MSDELINRIRAVVWTAIVLGVAGMVLHVL